MALWNLMLFTPICESLLKQTKQENQEIAESHALSAGLEFTL